MSLIEWVELPNLGDYRGSLMVAESNRNVPFKVERIYYILDVKPDVPRGFHAHKSLIQLAFCLRGSCKMLMDNGVEKQEVYINQANRGLLIPPLVWHEMHDFSEDCVMLVLASDCYDENDYIRDYETFKKYSNIKLVTYNEDFLEKSWGWLNDKEIKHLTMTPNFEKLDQVEFFQKIKTHTSYFIYGLVYAGNPIGACGLKNFIDNKAELWLYIGNKDYWGKGLGRIIMHYLESEAINKGLKKLYLKVIKENLVAIKLYKNTGYVEVDVNERFIIMEKDL